MKRKNFIKTSIAAGALLSASPLFSCLRSKEKLKSLSWANEAFLAQNEVYSFSDLPLWAPLSEDRGFMQISNEKLMQTEFEFTPVQPTLDDCLRWAEMTLDPNIAFGTAAMEIGLDRSRELALIDQLKVRDESK